MNKPVAIRYDFDGYGYQYMDSGSGSDWQTRVDGEPLYTHPVKELDEPNWKEMYWEMHELNHKHWSELKDHTKKLTDEEIDFIFFDLPSGHSIQEFARAILRKAQEK